MSTKTKTVISKEVALDDLERLVVSFVKRPEPREELEVKYQDTLEAIMDGFLTIGNDGVPSYKLKNAIKNDKGDDALTDLNFKTRILPSELTKLAKGLHPINDLYLLQNKMTVDIIGQPLGMLDKFSRYDLDVINQVASIFS